MSVNRLSPTDGTYVLGHADTEVQRLLLQGRLYDDFTEDALHRAGLRPGLRVLDVGCGPGDVSFVAARLVGPTGTVLGVDVADDVIEFARMRAAHRGLDTVRFETASIADISLTEPIDAVIGRLILMHLPDPVETLRQLAARVHPGGLIAFCELIASSMRAIPDLPLWYALKEAVINSFAGAGFDPEFGSKLHASFRRAGLAAPRLTLGAPLGAADDADFVAWAVETWRSLLPVAERLGLISDELADLDTLAHRLRDEAASTEAVAIMPPMVCATSRV